MVHPFLFAVSPVLTLFSHNVGQVAFSEVALPLGFSLLAAVVLLAVSFLIFRDSVKAAILVSLFLVLFFSHGHLMRYVNNWWIGSFHIGGQKPVLLFWLVLLICCFFLLLKTRSSLAALTKVLTVAATIMVLFPLVNIASFKIRAISGPSLSGTSGDVLTAVPTAADQHGGPDIYYIVLDRYGSERVLREFLDFDNSRFTRSLEERGFYVARESNANYQITAHSMASSLNLEYINYLSEQIGEKSSNWMPLFSRLQDYKIWRFLKARGYLFVHVGPKWQPTRKNKYADLNINFQAFPEFSALLLRTTMALPILHKFGIGDLHLEKAKRLLHEFDRLAEIPLMAEPTFTLVHMLAPHGPYVYDKDGSYLHAGKASKRSRQVNYIEQLEFLNSKLLQLVDAIMEKSSEPPIIVIQGDEGPYPSTCRGPDYSWTRATQSELRQKLGILNAYYLPGLDEDFLYPTITPVNSFRLIFRHYFDANLDLLPDRVYIMQDVNHLYKFYDVTDKVK